MIPWKERIFNVSILYFYENGFFSHMIYPEHSFSPYLILASSTFPLPDPLFPYSLHKRTGLQETTRKHDKTRYSNIRQMPSYQGWTRLLNRRKGVPRADIQIGTVFPIFFWSSCDVQDDHSLCWLLRFGTWWTNVHKVQIGGFIQRNNLRE